MMYTLVSGKQCIARTIEEFKIIGSDFESRAPGWIASCLENMELYTGYEHHYEEREVIDYKFKLPCDIKVLEFVEYEGQPLRQFGVANNRRTSSGVTTYSDAGFEIDINGYGITTFETGDVIVYYKRLPVELDDTLNLYIPKVPDNEKIKEAVCWYLFKRMQMRGYVHPVYSLQTNNPAVNTAVQYKEARKAARNASIGMDKSEREELSRLTRNFIDNYSAYSNEFFNSSNASTVSQVIVP